MALRRGPDTAATFWGHWGQVFSVHCVCACVWFHFDTVVTMPSTGRYKFVSSVSALSSKNIPFREST